MANLFTSQTPASGDNSDGTPGITTATAVRFAVDGNVSAGRFYATSTVGGTYTMALWEVTAADPNGSGGTLLASKTMAGPPTGGAWNTVTFDTPVAVVTTKLYKIGVFSGAGRYVFTGSFFGSDLVNGDITADANGDNPIGLGNLNQGSFTINAALAYPTSQPGSSCYFVDVDFSTASTPIAVGDTGAATEALTAAATVPLADTASTAEALTAAAVAALADAAAGTDQTAVLAGIPLGDTAAAGQAITATVTLPLADVGTTLDTAVGVDDSSVAKALADAGAASDRLRAATRRPNTGITARPNTGITLRP